jgi:hypothetical protein
MYVRYLLETLEAVGAGVVGLNYPDSDPGWIFATWRNTAERV